MSTSVSAQGGSDGEIRARLEELVRHFDCDSAAHGRALRELMYENQPAFCAGAIGILSRGEVSRASQCLVSLLVGNDLLLPALRDPSLSRDQALALARAAMRADAALDVRLARSLAEHVAAGTETEQDTDAGRIMDILGEISDGRRILPSLLRLMRTADPYLRSKAVLMIGRGSRSPKWVSQRLVDGDPRIRANALEALWGLDDDGARVLFKSMVNDPHNRVAGNAALGLYRLGDCSIIPDILKMAEHESPLFRATAAWVMGDTGDPRFLEALGAMLKDASPIVRKRVFSALGKIKLASARVLQGAECRLVCGPVTCDDAKGMRRFHLGIDAGPEGQPPRILPTHVILSEDGKSSIHYRVIEPPLPEMISVVFLFPHEEQAGHGPWEQLALQCLSRKRPPDVWARIHYLRDGSSAAAPQKRDVPKFHSGPLAITDEFSAPPQPLAGFWQVVRRSVDSKGLVLGKRHVIVLSSWAEGEGANAELVRLVKSSHARVDIVSSVPNPVLQDFCRQVDGGFQQAQSDHEIAGALELIYLNLLPRYEVSYQPVSAEAQSLRVRLFGPSCWGETSIPIPPRPPGISACL